MYKIEWKSNGANSLNSLHIDGKEYHSDAQKFAEKCNYYEKKFLTAFEDIKSDIFEKWISERLCIELLGKKNFNDAMAHGELGYTMEGCEMIFDRWEVLRLKERIIKKEELPPIAMSDSEHCPWCNKDVLYTTSGQGYCTCGFEK